MDEAFITRPEQGARLLFLETEEHKLYPNPARTEPWATEFYSFLGVVLGKASERNDCVRSS